MRLIAIEEHYVFLPEGVTPPPPSTALTAGSMPDSPFFEDQERMLTLGEKRLADMDADGISMQVVSAPMALPAPPDKIVSACRSNNAAVAAQTGANPARYAFFANVPTSIPEACAEEARHAIEELGAVGIIVNGASGGKFLSDPAFDDFLGVCEAREAPIYLHPAPPPPCVTEAYYAPNVSEDVCSAVSRYGFGWHVDSGAQMLNMILSGVFDRHPGLQVILGHWGEFLPFFTDRFDATMPASFLGTEHDPSYYLRNNLYVTPSGIFTPELLVFCKSILGADRIIFSVDYPLCTSAGKERILEHPDLTEEEKELIWHGNAERLLKIKA